MTWRIVVSCFSNYIKRLVIRVSFAEFLGKLCRLTVYSSESLPLRPGQQPFLNQLDPCVHVYVDDVVERITINAAAVTSKLFLSIFLQ